MQGNLRDLGNILLPRIRHTLMKSINFVIVGDYQIASELGKKGTQII